VARLKVLFNRRQPISQIGVGTETLEKPCAGDLMSGRASYRSRDVRSVSMQAKSKIRGPVGGTRVGVQTPPDRPPSGPRY
jgi:hypothetical protein